MRLYKSLSRVRGSLDFQPWICTGTSVLLLFIVCTGNYLSQSSSAKAKIPNAGAASLAPAARVSTPLLMNRTMASNSLDILSKRRWKLSSVKSAVIFALAEKDVSGTSMDSSSSSDSEDDESGSTRSDGCEKPMTFLRCRFCRLLRCRFMCTDWRDKS